MGEEEIEAAVRVLRSRSPFRFYGIDPQGEVEKFESEFAAFEGVSHCLAVTSGTGALHTALAAFGVGPGQEVIVPAYMWVSVAAAVVNLGAIPVLADIDPATFNLSAGAVEEVLRSAAGKKVKAVLPVHLYGQCADWDAFAELKRERGLLLVEDAAQAFGATWNGTPAGALGDAAAFSFYPTKNLSAMGDAGLVTTLSAEIDDHARVLRAHGMRRRYYHDEVGWNARMDGFQGAVLSVKLKYIKGWNEARRAAAAKYDALFRAAGLAESGPYPQHGGDTRRCFAHPRTPGRDTDAGRPHPAAARARHSAAGRAAA